MRVFLSSTSEDLKDFRAAACQVILEFDWHPVMMEHFGADSNQIVEACRQRVTLLVAYRQGWVPTIAQGGDGKKSIVELEFEQARCAGIPVIALMADRGWPGQDWENESTKRQEIERFRREVDRLAVFFSYEQPVVGIQETLPQFRSKLWQALVTHQRKQHDQERMSRDRSGATEEILQRLPDILASVTETPNNRRLVGPASLLGAGIGTLVVIWTMIGGQGGPSSQEMAPAKPLTFTVAMPRDVIPFEGDIFTNHPVYSQCRSLEEKNKSRYDFNAKQECEFLMYCLVNVYRARIL